MKQVLIAGLGKSGRGAVALLTKHFKDIKLYLYDQAIGRAEPPFLGLVTDQNCRQFFLNNPPDLVVLNPSISPKNPTIQTALSLGIEVVSEIELGYMFCKAKIIAITGTNGKSTTTALVSHLLSGNRMCRALGNIGVSFSGAVRELDEQDIVSLEVSSFQLETIKRFKPNVAMILNITPDHLDRHGSMENYARIKMSIARNQAYSDYLILNADDTKIENYLQGECFAPTVYFVSTKRKIQGAYIDTDGYMCFEGKRVLRVEELGLLGEHNISNALFAMSATILMGETAENVANRLKSFKGIRHRLEFLGTKNGQSFYNDSKATNVTSAITAFKALKGSTAVIMGGSDKGEDFDALFEHIPSNIKYIALIGATAQKLYDSAKKYGFEDIAVFDSLNSALESAISTKCQNVLLSPSCASFDMFANYEHRGDVFIGLVEGYLNSN